MVYLPALLFRNRAQILIDANEPSFLRKLRSEYGGSDSIRHERPLARPRKQIKDGEDDDHPTYVVEDTQDTMSKEAYDELLGSTKKVDETAEKGLAPPKQSDENHEQTVNSPILSSQDPVPAKEHTAAIGGSNKRRLAKIVGGESETQISSTTEGPSNVQRKSKLKRSKKVKLSFDEEGNGS